MIISRTPYRISFFGGGTDYPVWYRENKGAVLSTTIDKYAWLSVRPLPPFWEYRHRIVYSQTEMVRDIQEIHHPAVREVMKFLKIEEGLEIHHDGDLPASSGLGTSSAFTVGLLHSLYALKGIIPTKMVLAKEAIHIEQDLIREHVGSQDQVAASWGGLNRIDFGPGDDITVTPITLKHERVRELENHLMLVFTGVVRRASYLAQEWVNTTQQNVQDLQEMYQMVQEAIEILNSDRDITDFGKLLHQSWMLKRGLTESISPPYCDYLYNTALTAGAIGGKVLGAGGGGFILLFALPETQGKIQQELRLLRVPFRFEHHGSQVIFAGE